MKLNKISMVILAILFCTFLTVIILSSRTKEFTYNNETIKYERQIIKDVYTDLARYNPKDEATVIVELENTLSSDLKGDLYIRLQYLNETKEIIKDKVTVSSGGELVVEEKVQLPSDDFKGYLVEVWLKSNKEFYDMESTAIDVSSDWTKFPRYGYISVFNNKSSEEIEQTMENLNKFHINGLQFYDWHYKHQQPVAFNDKGEVLQQWNDIANRKIEKKVVEQYINTGHEKNIASMNYNLLFGAWEDYYEDGIKTEWGLYKDVKAQIQDYHPLPSSWATSKIYLFDPHNIEWQNYIIEKEKEVFTYFDFDGWHIDQLGDRGRLFNYNGDKINLGEGYVSLIKNAKDKLNKVLVFNAVNGFGQSLISLDRQVDFLYTEVWNTDNYAFLKNFIDEGFRFTDNELNMVLAAYVNYGVKGGEFNKNAVLLTDSVIFASGGAHIELGDIGMLSSEYFPNNKLKISEELDKALREYYDFMTAYENILRDKCYSINPKVYSDKINLSRNPRADKVWYFAKEKDNMEILQLINFTGIKSMNWRDDNGKKEEPISVNNFDIKYYITGDIINVSIASPDFNNSRLTNLNFENGTDEKGDYITFSVPELNYWDMIVIVKE